MLHPIMTEDHGSWVTNTLHPIRFKLCTFSLYSQNAHVCSCLCVCVHVYALIIVSRDKILCFTNTLIIILTETMEAGSQMCYTTSWHRSWRQGHKYANFILTQTIEARSQICYTSDSDENQVRTLVHLAKAEKEIESSIKSNWMLAHGCLSRSRPSLINSVISVLDPSTQRQASSNPKWPMFPLSAIAQRSGQHDPAHCLILISLLT